MVLETDRLILREYVTEDFDALFEIVSDIETMQHARAVRDWGFLNTQYDTIYSYMKYTNIGSYSTALANGMKKVKEYPDPKNIISYAYAITREEWKKLKEN